MEALNKNILVALAGAALAVGTIGCADGGYSSVIDAEAQAAANKPAENTNPQGDPQLIDAQNYGADPGLGRSVLEKVTIDLINTAESTAINGRIKSALEQFNVLNDRYPASHDEFMEQIVNAEGIQLPRLEPTERWVYEPDSHELKKYVYDRALEPGEFDVD
jgi:hypothetical protein